MFGPQFIAAPEDMRDTSDSTYTITDTWHFFAPMDPH